MAYTTQQALDTLNRYLGITDDKKTSIENTKNRGFIVELPTGEQVIIFVYPLVHKQDNTKNYFDTRDSGAYERGVAWKYALDHGMKYFCFGINDQVEKYSDYIFSLECNETKIEEISGTKDGSRNGPGNQIIIPNDYIPSEPFERIKNKLGIFISAVNKEKIWEYLAFYDNRPYLETDAIHIYVEQEEDSEEKNKRLFRYWMSMQVKPEEDSDAGNPYSETTITQYVSDISKVNLPMKPEKSVFYTTKIADIETTIEQLSKSEQQNLSKISAVKKYLEYVKNSEDNSADYDEVLKHNLWGIHIKEKNTALSEENPHVW